MLHGSETVNTLLVYVLYLQFIEKYVNRTL